MKVLIQYKYYFFGVFLFSIIFIYFLNNIFFNSDTAVSQIIGHDIARGNIFFKDWSLSTCSYILTDYIWHGIIAVFSNSYYTSLKIFIVSSIVLLYLTNLLIALAITRQCGERKIQANLIIFLFILSSITFFAIKEFIYNTPVHLTTTIFCLLSAVCFYSEKYNYKINIFFVLLSFLAMSSDGYAFFYFLIPLLLESGINYFKTRVIDKKLIYLVISLSCSLIFLKIVGIETQSPAFQFVQYENFPQNIYYFFGALFLGFSANFWGRELLHIATFVKLFLVVIIFILLSSYKKFFKHYTRFGMFLFLSALCIGSAYLFSTIPVNIKTHRFLVPIYINATPLAACLFYPYISHFSSRKLLIIAVSVLVLITCSFYTTEKDVRIAEAQAAINLLIKKNLQNGYGEFWSSHAVAALGNGKVVIAPIIPTTDGYAPYHWSSKRIWYKNTKPEFIIFDTVEPGNFDAKKLETTYGSPIEKLHAGRYEIWEYGRMPRIP